MMSRVVLCVPFVALLVACDRPGVAPASTAVSPLGPSAVAVRADSTVSARPMRAEPDVIVNMLDACDAATFNAVFPGVCSRDGGVKFDQFIAELTRLASIGPWRFAGSKSEVEIGQDFVAINKGGEVHTFTEVAEFGGGVNDVLNQLSRVPDVAPECNALEPDDFVAPGGTYRATVNHGGPLKFQCCIHPWMRLEASSR